MEAYGESEEETGLADSGVPNQQHFEQVVAKGSRQAQLTTRRSFLLFKLIIIESTTQKNDLILLEINS